MTYYDILLRGYRKHLWFVAQPFSRFVFKGGDGHVDWILWDIPWMIAPSCLGVQKLPTTGDMPSMTYDNKDHWQADKKGKIIAGPKKIASDRQIKSYWILCITLFWGVTINTGVQIAPQAPPPSNLWLPCLLEIRSAGGHTHFWPQKYSICNLEKDVKHWRCSTRFLMFLAVTFCLKICGIYGRSPRVSFAFPQRHGTSRVSSAVLQRLPQAAELKDQGHCWLRFSAALARQWSKCSVTPFPISHLLLVCLKIMNFGTQPRLFVLIQGRDYANLVRTMHLTRRYFLDKHNAGWWDAMDMSRCGRRYGLQWENDVYKTMGIHQIA